MCIRDRSKKIDNYLDGKIKRTAGVYAPLDLFAHLAKRRKVYSYEEAKQRAIDLLAEVGISRPEKVVDNYPFQLSGGMCQRVMIAMALSCHPKLLIADEPTTALDVTIQAQILSLMNRLKNETGTSIMLITHDLGVVAQVADNVNVMYAGKVVETAPVEELFSNPKHLSLIHI